ncbi:MAG: hypothetical protein ABJC10_11775 [Acidobacteriota bacterium]
MKTYRRIEVNAFRRRVTIVSGEWPRPNFDAPSAQTDDDVSLNDSDSSEPVAPDSPEGQLLLVEAVRSLERRLSPEARALLSVGQELTRPIRSHQKLFCPKWHSFYRRFCPDALRFTRKEK